MFSILKRASFATLAALGASVLLDGCGGSSGSASPVPIGSGQNFSIGSMSVNYTGKNVARSTFSQNGISVFSVAGATINSLAFASSQNLKSTTIAFSNYDGGLGTISLSTYATAYLDSQGITEVQGVSATADGRLLFTAVNPSNGIDGFYTCYPDGSGLTLLVASTGQQLEDCSPVMSPNGKQIAFSNDSGQMFVCDANGANQRMEASSVDFVSPPTWSPDSSQLAFASGHQIKVVKLATGTTTQISDPGEFAGFTCSAPCWSPNGQYVAFNAYDQNDPNQIFIDDVSVHFAYGIPDIPNYSDRQPEFSPDGSMIAFISQPTAGGASHIFEETISGDQRLQLTSNENNPFSLSWGPFEKYRKFVGSDGTMLPSSAGFIYATNNELFNSILTFTAKTPSTAVVTPPTQTGSGNSSFAYTLHADQIQTVKFTNSFFSPGVTYTLNSTDVLIEIGSGGDGVVTVAPFVKAEGSGLPRITKIGDHTVYTGKFKSFWRLEKNFAPDGGTRIELDKNHGLVSAR